MWSFMWYFIPTTIFLQGTYYFKTMLNIFCGWKHKTLIQLYGKAVKGVVFQGHWKIYFLVFLVLVWFVVLHVIVRWSWWVGFSDGAQSWWLNVCSLWVVWIMVLEEDWCGVELSGEWGVVKRKKLYEASRSEER